MKNILKWFIWMLLFIVLSVGNLMSAQSCEWSDLPFCCNGTPSYEECNSTSPSPEQPSQECKDWCCGIKLNTNFPGIWNCIKVSQWDSLYAFPNMVSALTKFIMSLILVVCFILVIYAGILWASDNPKDAKKWLQRVVVTILLLWFSWAILRLINPNFFS